LKIASADSFKNRGVLDLATIGSIRDDFGVAVLDTGMNRDHITVVHSSSNWSATQCPKVAAVKNSFFQDLGECTRLAVKTQAAIFTRISVNVESFASCGTKSPDEARDASWKTTAEKSPTNIHIRLIVEVILSESDCCTGAAICFNADCRTSRFVAAITDTSFPVTLSAASSVGVVMCGGDDLCLHF
jgi:hypothetical protein